MVIARAPKKKRKKLLIIRNLCFIFNMNKIVLIIISLSELFIFHGALSLYSHMWTIFVLFFCIQFFDCAVSLVIWWFCSNSCTFYSHWLYTILEIPFFNSFFSLGIFASVFQHFRLIWHHSKCSIWLHLFEFNAIKCTIPM